MWHIQMLMHMVTKWIIEKIIHAIIPLVDLKSCMRYEFMYISVYSFRGITAPSHILSITKEKGMSIGICSLARINWFSNTRYPQPATKGSQSYKTMQLWKYEWGETCINGVNEKIPQKL